MRGKPVTALLICFAFAIPTLHAQSQPPAKTVLDGVYSEVQAERGRTFYTSTCGACHGQGMEGVSAPALLGERFVERWREGVVGDIYNYIRERMPPARDRNARPILDDNYLDIVTYILKSNGYRTGSNELAPNMLGSVIFVGKDGPRPVPDGSLVVTVGCLSQIRDDLWSLARATEPMRTRSSTTSTSAELAASAKSNLGTLTFRLTDLEAVPAFMPDTHNGHRMQVKGYLVRQINAERINLSSVEMLDSTCGP